MSAELLGLLPKYVSPLSEWPGTDLSAGHCHLNYRIDMSPAPLAPCVLFGIGSSLVVSSGPSMPPIFNSPVSSHSFPFLIDYFLSSAA